MAIKKSTLLVWALAICLVGALAGIAYLRRTVSRQSAAMEELSRENRDLRALADAARNAPVEEPRAEHAAPAIGAPAGVRPTWPDQTSLVQDLNAKLAEANTSLAALELRLQELRVEVQGMGVDNKRLAASEEELKQDLASANRLIAAHESELKSRRDRVVQLEIANRKLRDQSAAENARLSQLGQISAELQEVSRRREALLASVLRRYKEVTDQYRALTSVLDDRAQADGPPLAGADMARIQNSISLAEDDLRQLNALSAQVMRLEKKIGAW